MLPRFFWLISFLAPVPLTALYFYTLFQQQELVVPGLALLAVIGLTWARWDYRWKFPFAKIPCLLYALGFTALVVAIAIWSPWLANFSELLLVASFFATHDEAFQSSKRRRLSQRSLLYLIVPLCVVVRIPLGWENNIYNIYFQNTSRFGSYLLDSLQIPHFLNGTILEIASQKIVVEKAIGTFQMPLAIILISLLIFALQSRPLIVAPVYLLAGLIVSGVLQTFQLAIAALTIHYFQIDILSGAALLLFKAFSFAVAIWLLYSFDALIMFFFAPVGSDTIHISNSSGRNPFKVIWNRLLRRSKSRRRSTSRSRSPSSWLLIPLYSLLILGAGLQVVLATQKMANAQPHSIASSASGKLWSPPANLFSMNDYLLENFEQVEDGSDIAQAPFADIWTFYHPQQNIRHRIVISQPYNRFYDLDHFYARAGWSMQPRMSSTDHTFSNTESVEPTAWPIAYTYGTHASGKSGFLTYSALNVEAKPVPPPERSFTTIVGERLFTGRGPTQNSEPCLMFQMLTTSDIPFTPEQQRELLELHEQFRTHVKDSFALSQPIPSPP